MRPVASVVVVATTLAIAFPVVPVPRPIPVVVVFLAVLVVGPGTDRAVRLSTAVPVFAFPAPTIIRLTLGLEITASRLDVVEVLPPAAPLSGLSADSGAGVAFAAVSSGTTIGCESVGTHAAAGWRGEGARWESGDLGHIGKDGLDGGREPARQGCPEVPRTRTAVAIAAANRRPDVDSAVDARDAATAADTWRRAARSPGGTANSSASAVRNAESNPGVDASMRGNRWVEWFPYGASGNRRRRARMARYCSCSTDPVLRP